jgi:hypothetical protein
MTATPGGRKPPSHYYYYHVVFCHCVLLNRFAFLPFKHTHSKKLNLAKIKEVAIEEEIKEGI